MKRARPSIKSPCVADVNHADDERIAEVFWPGHQPVIKTRATEHDVTYDAAGCLISVSRASNGAPMLDVYRCDPSVRVRVVWDNLSPMAITDLMIPVAETSIDDVDTVREALTLVMAYRGSYVHQRCEGAGRFAVYAGVFGGRTPARRLVDGVTGIVADACAAAFAARRAIRAWRPK